PRAFPSSLHDALPIYRRRDEREITLDQVQIRAADSARAHADEHFARLRRGHRTLPEHEGRSFDRRLGVDRDGPHLFLDSGPHNWRIPTPSRAGDDPACARQMWGIHHLALEAKGEEPTTRVLVELRHQFARLR